MVTCQRVMAKQQMSALVIMVSQELWVLGGCVCHLGSREEFMEAEKILQLLRATSH